MENKIIIFRDNGGFVQLVDHVGDDLAVLNSPQASLGEHKEALAEEDKNRIEHLIEQNQTGTLRHCSAMFKIKAPLFVAKEHIGLSEWNCSEINKHYADANSKFYEPTVYRAQAQHGFEPHLINPVLQSNVRLARFRVYRTSRAMNMHHASSLQLYQNMIQEGVSREQAAGVLPQNIYVEYYASAPLDVILSFTDMIGDEYVLSELRETATAVSTIMRELFPVSTEKWEKSTKKKKATVERRLTKLGKVLAVSENLNNEQLERLKEVKQQLQDIVKRRQKNTNENTISKEEQGTGSTADPKESKG